VSPSKPPAHHTHFGARRSGTDARVSAARRETQAAPAADDAAGSAEPAPEPKKAEPKKSKKNKKQTKNPAVSESVDLLYTNTGAVDLVLASDAAGNSTWIKEVKSTRLQPGMRLVSMEVYDPTTKRLAPRDLAGLPFLDAVKEVEAQSIIGTEGGISPFHLKFDPDPQCPPVDGLTNAKLVRMEARYEKEVIDALEAIDRGTER
jgi:hypothetical protein